MDAQRALLDELMGRNRDGDKPEEDISDFRHERVCKRFLCGLCPHDLFQNTKMDLGECAQLHLPKMRVQYEKEKEAQPTKDFGYEQELERDLVKFISEVEKKIQRAQRRLEEQDGAKAPSLMDFESCKEVLEITAEIQEVMQKAEEAGGSFLHLVPGGLVESRHCRMLTFYASLFLRCTLQATKGKWICRWN